MSTPISTDAHLQVWMTAPEERRAASHAALIGTSEPKEAVERRYGLKEIAEHPAVRKHPVWLSKIGVPEVCGERLAGHRSYTLGTVLAYLKSDECRARIAELNRQRRVRERAKKAAEG